MFTDIVIIIKKNINDSSISVQCTVGEGVVFLHLGHQQLLVLSN